MSVILSGHIRQRHGSDILIQSLYSLGDVVEHPPTQKGGKTDNDVEDLLVIHVIERSKGLEQLLRWLTETSDNQREQAEDWMWQT